MGISDKLNSKLISLLKDSILISANVSNVREIIFDFISNKNDEWSRHYLYIRDSENFYFQRYESSFQRNGLSNLRRIKIKDNKAEWISELNDWRNLFTKESGVEFKLYNGSIFRFVGSNLSLELSFVEGPIDSIDHYINEKPDYIGQSKAKVIVNETLTKPVITIKEKQTIDDGSDSITGVEIEEIKLYNKREIDPDNQFEPMIEENINPDLEKALEKIDNLTDKEIEDRLEINNNSYEESTEATPTLNIAPSITEVESEETTEIEEKNEENSLINQISEYALPKQADTILADTKIEHHEYESGLNNSMQSIEMVDGVTKSNLTSIEALGFNTIIKLSDAKIAELTKINGVGKVTARKIIKSAKSKTDGLES